MFDIIYTERQSSFHILSIRDNLMDKAQAILRNILLFYNYKNAGLPETLKLLNFRVPLVCPLQKQGENWEPAKGLLR
jgi:hypothetical protein